MMLSIDYLDYLLYIAKVGGNFHFLILTKQKYCAIMVVQENIHLRRNNMFSINCPDFNKLLGEYREPTTKEEQLIQHKLYAIVDLYRHSSLKEREFADEIMFEFCRIVRILKDQHSKEIADINQKLEELENEQRTSIPEYMACYMPGQTRGYEYDYQVLADFYDHFRKPDESQLSYLQIDNYIFESEEERKKLVNLTMIDYCNRIKTFAKRYLHEIVPIDEIPLVIHENETETREPIVFVYNHLEYILAKMKTTDENGKTVKQRLNIRSALRRLNEFKQGAGGSMPSQASSYRAISNPFEYACVFESDESIEEAYIYYLMNYYKKEKLTKSELSNACSKLSKLWQLFYSAYENGDLPQELSDALDEDTDIYGDVLVNVHMHFDMLSAYCAMMKASAGTSNMWESLDKELERFLNFVIYVRNN